MNSVNNYSLVLNGNPGNTPVKVDHLSVKKAAVILRAINHKLRQQILRLLDEHTKLTVTEVYIRLRLEQSVASQHLAILRRAGFVKTERDGKFIYYMVNTERLQTVNQFVDNLVG
ncbi:MAG TPA: metalloregulator ArsR/SmtB family transcription factor [Chitinophagaceae bacterium]